MLLDRTYNHRSKQDLQDLYRDVQGLDVVQKALVVSVLVAGGSMQVPLLFRLPLMLMRRKFQEDRLVAAALFHVIAKNDRVVETMWSQSLKHMLHGKDQYDALSAGGWNRKELDLFISAVNLAKNPDNSHREAPEQVAALSP